MQAPFYDNLITSVYESSIFFRGSSVLSFVVGVSDHPFPPEQSVHKFVLVVVAKRELKILVNGAWREVERACVVSFVQERLGQGQRILRSVVQRSG